MSHIDEGTLHAYLDGALDLYPEDEARQVREHLESCDECRERLEEERAVRDEANAILGSVVPDVAPPPLEELRAEAARRGTTEQRRGLSRMNRWAWAASVVLALGTGWMLRGSIGGWISQPDPQEQAAEPSVAQPAQADGATGFVEEASEPDSQGAALPTPPPPETEVPEAEAGRTEAASGAGEATEPAATQPAVAAPAGTAPATTEAEEGGSDTAQAGGAPKPVAVAEGAPGVITTPVAAERDAPTLEARRADTSPFRVEQVQEAPVANFQVLPVPTAGRPGLDDSRMTIPGLRVLRAYRVGEGESIPLGTVRVLQRTETGDTLELLHFQPGTEPSAVPAGLDPGMNEVVILKGFWTMLRGRMSEDELIAYGERIPHGG